MRFITKSFTKGQKGFKGLKRLTFAVSLATTLIFSHSTFAQGAPNILYDTSGSGVAVVENTNGTTVVYSTAGDPLGYVANNTGAIFTFDGKQVGWYDNGIMYDMNGYQLAFPEDRAPQTVVVKKVQTINPNYKPLPNRTVVTETTTTVTRPAFTQQIAPTGFSSVFTITPAQ